jgi:hypothetical protein
MSFTDLALSPRDNASKGKEPSEILTWKKERLSFSAP